MRHCANRDCPHRRRFGAPAEYQDGVASCSDCGAALSDGARPDSPPPPARAPAPPVPGALWLRLAVTVAAVAAAQALAWLPLAGYKLPLYRHDFYIVGANDAIGVGALGLVPFLSAFLLVELVALAVPRWRPLRHGGFAGRAALTRASVAVAAALALLQGWTFARYLEATTWSGAEIDLRYFAPVTTATLAGGAFLLYALARLIDRRGLGNGIVILTVAGVVREVAGEVSHVAVRSLRDQTALVPWLHAALIALVVAMAWYATRTRRQAGGFVARVPTAGVVPLELGATLLALPATLAGMLALRPLGEIANRLAPGEVLHTVLLVILAAGMTPLLARLFHRRRSLGALADAAEAPLRGATAWSVTFVTLLVALEHAALRWAHVPLPTVALAAATAAGVDLAREWRDRRGGAWVAAWPLARPWQADVALAALRARDIPAFARGDAFRSLYHFFAPWAPVEVMVPVERAAEAEALLREQLPPV